MEIWNSDLIQLRGQFLLFNYSTLKIILTDIDYYFLYAIQTT